MMTSAADTPSSEWMSTGMPRPLSITVTASPWVEDHPDLVAIAFKGFIDRVIDELLHHVMQAGAIVGIANVHARTLAYRVQAAQYLDVLGVVRCHTSELIGWGVQELISPCFT